MNDIQLEHKERTFFVTANKKNKFAENWQNKYEYEYEAWNEI